MVALASGMKGACRVARRERMVVCRAAAWVQAGVVLSAVMVPTCPRSAGSRPGSSQSLDAAVWSGDGRVELTCRDRDMERKRETGLAREGAHQATVLRQGGPGSGKMRALCHWAQTSAAQTSAARPGPTRWSRGRQHTMPQPHSPSAPCPSPARCCLPQQKGGTTRCLPRHPARPCRSSSPQCSKRGRRGVGVSRLHRQACGLLVQSLPRARMQDWRRWLWEECRPCYHTVS
mmetsp:Transcript_23555/g.58978  ORF Transcript_23555/g.58978 Transcript_23555/m.58978 type:complete len:232 (+) Transcript_23555:271-966(+)